MLDVIVIGAGPAGITAAVYAVRKGLSVLVVSKDIGGQTAWSGDIENYTGYQFVTGPELTAKFEEHMKKYDIAIKEGEEAVDINKDGSIVIVKTDKATYKAKTAIVASGKRTKELNIPGEKEFKNKGLTYCATCDGPLFSGKKVAVIGSGNSGLDATLQLVGIAKYVYLIERSNKPKGDAIMLDKIRKNDNVKILTNTQVSEIRGDKFVNKIKIRTENKEQDLDVEGVFVEIGLIPNSEFCRKLDKNQWGEIKVNNRNETNIPGILAAGDVSDVPEKQIIIAAGEGSKATLSAFHYLSRMK